MILHQATYGAHQHSSRGHGLIHASGDIQLAKAIAHKVDLPDTVPTGITCPSYLTGFLHQAHYVLARITLDSTASRGGMVFSHAIFIPIDEVGEIADLRPLVDVLTFSHEETDKKKLEPVEFNLSDLKSAPPASTDSIVGISNALVSSGKLPVIYCGEDNFDNKIILLWGNLWPALRRQLAFRLTFSPRDLESDDGLSVTFSPPQLVSRWGGYQVVKSDSQLQANSLASELVCGLSSAEPLRQFMEGIGTDVNGFKKIRLLAHAYEYANAKDQKFDSLTSAIRIIGEQIAPSLDVGVSFKAKLLSEFVATFEFELTPEKLLRLRNLSLASFPSYNMVWCAVSEWLACHEFAPVHDENTLRNLREAQDLSAEQSNWNNAVSNGVLHAIVGSNPSIYLAIWRWFENDWETANKLVEIATPKTVKIEEKLANAAPTSLLVETSKNILRLSHAQQWWILYGTVLASSVAPYDAIRKQLEVDSVENNNAGLLQALKNATDQEVLSASLEFGDSRLIAIAANIVAKKPFLLGKSDFTQPNTHNVWASALKIDSTAWRVSSTPWEAVFKVLEALLSGCRDAMPLVDLLSRLEIADLCRYTNRANVWAGITDAVVKDRYLTATSLGWLELISSGSNYFDPDPVLQKRILQCNVEDTLQALPDDKCTVGIAIIQALPEMREDTVTRWLETLCRRTKPLTERDSCSLGILINSRKLRNALNVLIRQYDSGHSDLKHGLTECCDMLNWWDCYRLKLTSITELDVWKAFTEVAAELYPEGPNQNALWERAEGKTEDLDIYGSGLQRWHSAIRKMKYGSYPKPHVALNEMRSDYPHNEKLNWLGNHMAKLS